MADQQSHSIFRQQNTKKIESQEEILMCEASIYLNELMLKLIERKNVGFLPSNIILKKSDVRFRKSRKCYCQTFQLCNFIHNI